MVEFPLWMQTVQASIETDKGLRRNSGNPPQSTSLQRRTRATHQNETN